MQRFFKSEYGNNSTFTLVTFATPFLNGKYIVSGVSFKSFFVWFLKGLRELFSLNKLQCSRRNTSIKFFFCNLKPQISNSSGKLATISSTKSLICAGVTFVNMLSISRINKKLPSSRYLLQNPFFSRISKVFVLQTPPYFKTCCPFV